MSLEFMPYYTINYNGYEKNENVITEKDINFYFDEGLMHIKFNDPEKKKLLIKLINTDKGHNLYNKLLQKKSLNIPVNNENMYKIKTEILKVMNDLIKQSKYSNFLENE